ncbi:fucolectin-4-like [Gigantopelta aegis]|uniref:fucolectin-4-like n=1 Tax=Gigantopelta aegis TaxID=1735272 RepID=UPI001B88E596|nr:fucolectin-4-like [Gigantopelta aegis]
MWYSSNVTWNLAFEKPAAMSTVFSNYHPPSKAVNGHLGTHWDYDFCTATKHGDMEPWWIVDLHGLFLIRDFIITNRGDYLWERLHSFTIDVFTQNPVGCPHATSVQCYNRTDPLGEGETLTLSCHAPVIGRFVRIRKWKMADKVDILTFCQVQIAGTRVTGCDATKYLRRKQGIRLISKNVMISDVADIIHCLIRCGNSDDCLALNYNYHDRQCQLISTPNFSDSTLTTSLWDYYGMDMC